MEVEMWGAAHARALAKAGWRERERTARAWAALAKVRAEAEARAWRLVRVQAQTWAMAAEAAEAALTGADVNAMRLARMWAHEQARQLSWAWARAAERAQSTRALEGLGLGLGQVREWLRLWRLGEEGERKMKKLFERTAWYLSLNFSAKWAKFYNKDAWPRREQGYWWLIQVITPVARLPPELLQQIFLIIIDNDNDSPLVLMRVCIDWYNIITGIWASLKLGTTTRKGAVTAKLERNQWFLDVLVNTEVDRRHLAQSKADYQAIFAAMQVTSRWRSLVVETFPTQADLPEDLVNRGLQQCSDPVMSRLRTLIIKCPCERSSLLDYLLCILGNSASRELTTVTLNSPIAISFLVPTYSSIFRSVTVLSLDAPGLRNPVDLLPHLHQLKTLTASHLPLPVYHDDVDLPFIHTLRHLTLRSVSIQWMSGRTFHVLKSCTILFPFHRHILHTFRTTLPNCRYLSFEGYPLDILSGASAHKLTNLSVKCSSSHKPRGNRQLALFSSQALQEGRLAPRVLHVSIEAMNSAWTKSFAYMSNLEELVIENAQPSSLGVKALRALVALPDQANNAEITATPVECNTPMCPSLRRFGLRYRRWLRSSEHFDLIPVFMSIIRSRQQSMFPMQSFRIWTRSDQDDPLELIEGSSISAIGFEHLKDCAAITGQNL